MSTRYVWGKYNLTADKENVKTDYATGSNTSSNWQLYAQRRGWTKNTIIGMTVRNGEPFFVVDTERGGGDEVPSNTYFNPGYSGFDQTSQYTDQTYYTPDGYARYDYRAVLKKTSAGYVSSAKITVFTRQNPLKSAHTTRYSFFHPLVNSFPFQRTHRSAFPVT